MESDQVARWATFLQGEGYRVGGVLGSGMEGTVLDLGADLVAKVWSVRPAAELQSLQTFYASVTDAGPAVRTPRFQRVLELDGQAATVEPRLAGRPLRASMGAKEDLVREADVACVLNVLDALHRVVPTEGMRVLPVLPGEAPFGAGESFERSLAELVERRARRFREPLSSRIADLDALVAAVTSCLTEPEPASPRLLHGDLIPANILVDAEIRAVAVLDFGFLSTVGDPSFDAAVMGSVFDMYGARAATSEAILTEAVIDRFGYEERRLWVYRAAYAIATSNCFSSSGTDGHFEWCLHMLARAPVRVAIAL